MSRFLHCLALGLFVVACSNELLPEAATALEEVKGTALEVQEAYEQAAAAKAALESVYTQVCIPPVVPQALDACADIRVALDKADEVETRGFEALTDAFKAINVAIDAYNKINDEVGQ